MVRYVKNKNQVVSNRTKDAYLYEKRFAKLCRRRKWVIQKTDLFVMYLINPNYIGRKRVKWGELESIEKAIKSVRLMKALMALLLKHGWGYTKTYNEDDDEDEFKVGTYGLPDFIILSPSSKTPFWVEVKSGSAKMKPKQILMKSKLEDIGFKVFLYRGGRISYLKDKIEQRYDDK